MLVGLAACQLNQTGAGTGSAASVGEGSEPTDGGSSGLNASTTAPDVGEGTGGGGTTEGPSADTTDSGPDPDSGEPATDGAEGPLLAISGSPEHDFGNVDVDTAGFGMLSVANAGDAIATGMDGLPMAGPFAFTGGTYPGMAGDCGSTLDPGESCSLDLSFTPSGLGLFDGRVRIAYDGAEAAERRLIGGGAGQTDNLLSNPGGETTGSPVSGWTDVGPGQWGAGAFTGENWPHAGNAYIYSDGGPNNEVYRLVQDIDVSQWATTIDAEAMVFEFEGWGRTYSNGDDEYRLRVLYLAGDMTLEAFTSGWQSGGSWAEHTDTRPAPAGTRTVQVDLSCEKSGGGVCNAYYDSLVLTARYP